MLSEQRQEIILKLLKEKGSITVSELKDVLNSSEATIRRDLNFLDEEKKLVKVFGGAVSNNFTFLSAEPSVSQKKTINTEEKKKIAEYAASLIEPNDFIYIDAGTTTEYMLGFIKERRAVYVTNAVSHAKRLASDGFKVELIGGELKEVTEAVVGARAVLTLARMNFNKGFFGANGVSEQRGFTTPDVNEASVKEVAFNNCLNRYVLADSGKIGNISSVRFGEISDAYVITGKEPEARYQRMENFIVV
jgi:DeoR family fructose operon transcriptional repressor